MHIFDDLDGLLLKYLGKNGHLNFKPLFNFAKRSIQEEFLVGRPWKSQLHMAVINLVRYTVFHAFPENVFRNAVMNLEVIRQGEAVFHEPVIQEGQP